jgi:NMD protein affecting ribosome stability and mRNA decay
VAVVLTLVTNNNKYTLTKKYKNTVNTITLTTKTPTHYKTHTNTHTPTHYKTHTNTHTHTHTLQNPHIHTLTYYQTS